MNKPHIKLLRFYGTYRFHMFVDRKSADFNVSWIARASSIRKLSKEFRMRKSK